MLKELTIKNYALIDHLQISFENGFSVITGETGSGKSIMLGAMALMLGERADLKSIRNSEQKCIIEGTFTLSKKAIFWIFEKHDLDFQEETILRREITSQGKSRAFINDTPVSLQVLKELSENLIDIHSQHETLLLNDKTFVFGIIDSQISRPELIETFRLKYDFYKQENLRLERLIEKEQKSQSDKEFIDFLIKEFEDINIEKAIDQDWESEYLFLSNAEDVKNALSSSIEMLSLGEKNASSLVQKAIQFIHEVKSFKADFGLLEDRMRSVLIELQDVSSELSKLDGNLEMDDRRRAFLEVELSGLNRLQKKHGLASYQELLDKKQELLNSLASIGSISEEVSQLTKANKVLREELEVLAKEITKERSKIIPVLEKDAQSLLSKMKMKHAEIRFELNRAVELNSFGLDEIQLLAKTNLGGTFDLLKKIASGGESSRIMLAIKSLQTQKKSLPTIIFDEIDTGVSGEVATNMADIMKSLGTKMQVMSITHLPQIAAKGEHHYKVYKEEVNQTTTTNIILLNNKLRVKEIAQMLSGEDITEAALHNAEELLR